MSIDNSSESDKTNFDQSIKLQKILADAGIGSRREMERWIALGRITVNHKKAHLGDRACPSDIIRIDGKKIAYNSTVTSGTRVLVYHKPEGELCSHTDDQQRPLVYDKLPPLSGERWISVGRLDINTSGLLLFTTNGTLASRLMHPSYEVEREYAVRVMGEVTPENTQNLFEGVQMEDGVSRFTDIVDGGGTGINHWFHVCLTEGKNREVRRLWESQGLQVSRLKRVRFGGFIIPRGLRVGQWKILNTKEVHGLTNLVAMPAPKVLMDIPLSSHNNKGKSKRRNDQVKSKTKSKFSTQQGYSKKLNSRHYQPAKKPSFH